MVLPLLLILAAASPLGGVGAGARSAPARPAWPDTSEGIHAFLVGDDYAPPSVIEEYADRLSFVLRATQMPAWRSSNHRDILLARYMPYTRDPSPSCHPQPCDMLPWWQRNHPELVLYRCDRKTPALECWPGGIPCTRLSIPLDLTLNQTLEWQMAEAVLPAKAAGQRVIELDNYNLCEPTACTPFRGPIDARVSSDEPGA